MNNFTEFGPSLETTMKKKRNFALEKVREIDKNEKRVIMHIDFKPHMPVASSVLQKNSYINFTGFASGHTHTITETLSCQTTNCVYCWRCTKPNCVDFPQCEYV